MSHYLYRNFARGAIVVLSGMMLFVPFCAAQVLQDHTQHEPPPPANETKINTKTTKRGPRALGVVEFLPGGQARLVPIALWIDGRYYDASLYAANPEPMALEPETVYEATDYGEPTGFFTVTTPQQVKGNWVAEGQWKAHAAMDEKVAQQKAKQPKPKEKSYDPNSDRPVLKRGGSSDSSSAGSGSPDAQSSASGTAAPSSPEPSDRPVLKKPNAPSSDTGTSAASSSAPATTVASSTPAQDENDPNRPTLRRGKAPQQATTSESSTSAVDKNIAAMDSAQGKLMATMAAIGHRSYPAISDAGTYETRSLLYAMNATERANKANQLRALALDEIAKFIAKRKTPALPKSATITSYDLRAYDLDYSSSPTFVLTAALPVEGAKALRGGEFDYYVTVVAREDINGIPIKIFSAVSDTNHLDSFPRMEMVDAVDADANGRGDLLFRQYSDVGISYGLYRVYPYDMQKVFEGGSAL
jgi:hypothetical protein